MVLGMRKVSRALTTVMKYAMVALFIWMVVSLGIQVFARYLFHKSFVWSEESARYCMIWMIFIGTTEIIFNSSHIKITILQDIARGVGKKIVLAIQDIICIVFSVMLAYYSFPQVALSAKAVSSNMNINMGIVFAIFPIVTILMAVGYLFKLILLFVDRSGGEAGLSIGEHELQERKGEDL